MRNLLSVTDRSSGLNWSSLRAVMINEGFAHLVFHVIRRITSLCEYFAVVHVRGRFRRFVKGYYFHVVGCHSFVEYSLLGNGCHAGVMNYAQIGHEKTCLSALSVSH